MSKRKHKRKKSLRLLLPAALLLSAAGPWYVPYEASAAGTQIQVDLSSYFNEDGFSFESNRSDGSFDQSGYTYAAELVNMAPAFGGTNFRLGTLTDGSNNSVKATGQTLLLDQGKYNQIRLLGSASGGNQTGTFRILYADSTYSDVSVTMRDWCHTAAGDQIVLQMAHRHKSSGNETATNYIFDYDLSPDPGKTVTGIVLPNNANMHVMAVSLVAPDAAPAAPDYRGRVKIPQTQMSVTATSAQSGHGAEKAFDGSGATTWAASGSSPQSLIIDLNTVYTVSKMDYLGDITNLQNHVDQYKVSVSTDGTNYTEVVTNGNFQWTGYEMKEILNNAESPVQIYFNPTPAKYIKLEFLTTHNASYPQPMASEINVYRDTASSSPPAAPIPATETYINPRLSLASQVLIEKGLQIHSWMPSEKYGREFPAASEFNNMHLTGTTYYDPPLYNSTLQNSLPGMQWNLAKAPYATNAVGQNPPSTGDYLTAEQIADVRNLISVCFGDEQNYSTAEETYLTNWFNLSHQLYPRVLLHTNQYSGQWSQAQLKSYMQKAKPDLLTFDTYFWDQTGSIPDYQSTNKILSALNYQRPLALQGIDGTGAKPIGFGQYLGSFKNGGQQAGSGWYESTASQKFLVTNLSLAMGAKWLDLFRFEYSDLYAILFDKNGAPTHHYYEFAENFKQSRNLGPHLVRLNNVDVRVKPGQHLSGSSPVANVVPSGWGLGAFAANTEFHISDLTAINTGTQNNSLSGDVAIGYFKALPGYDTRSFFTSTDPKYMMVVNGLASGNGQRPENQHGTLDDTNQNITLTFTKSSGLKKVNRQTGAIEAVNLTSIGGGKYTATFQLGGGEAELIYWDENKTVLSADANLLSLGTSQGTLAPAFSASTTSYTVNVPANITSINVSAFSVAANATVTIDGKAPNSKGEVPIGLSAPSTPIQVVVSPENGGAAKSYSLNIVKQ